MNTIKSYPTAKETAQSLATFLKDKINASNTFYLAISGGSTPKMLFEAMTAIKVEITWRKLHLFWVDERCVAPEHEESNYRMTFENLLSNVPLPEDNIHRMKGELTPEEGLVDYQKDIDGLPKAKGLPQFDLIILGMGDDGHTASIFPPSKELITVESDLAIGTNPYSGQKRLTLTGRTIKNATKLIFHVTGANKAQVLDEILNEKGKFKDYPSFYFKDDAEWWLDDAALTTDN
jgi:6-phosphogluconolactonase